MKFSTSSALVSGLPPPENFLASEDSQPASLSLSVFTILQFNPDWSRIDLDPACTSEYGWAVRIYWELSSGSGIVFPVILDDEAHTASRETKWRRFRENLQHFHNIQYRSGARKWQPATLSRHLSERGNPGKRKGKKITQKIINHRVCLNIGDPLIPLLILFTRHYFSMKLKLKTILDQSA